MPHSTAGSASGNGSIRKKTVKRNGKDYSYWEARYTAGFDPCIGKQIQRSISGKTKKEVAQKLRQVLHELETGAYIEPNKLTVGEWLDTWSNDFLVAPKRSTMFVYCNDIKLYLKPGLGSHRLSELSTIHIQRFYNYLLTERGLSPKTVHDVHGVLHQALQQAVSNKLLASNPSDACRLPKCQHREIHPFDVDEMTEFFTQIRDHPHELLYKISMFTGMREGEVLGLRWDNVDLERGIITVRQQLWKNREAGGEYCFTTPKNGKSRIVAIAPSVVELFRQQRKKQEDTKREAGSAWNNKYNLVFTNAIGDVLSYRTVYDCFKRIVKQMGRPDMTFHDLRHTYATISIANGDDIKTVQENLGHATAAFTLDFYGHVTDSMRKHSTERMENFIQGLN